jgi:hypothetical protein
MMNSIDWYLIQHGMTHPDIWLMWLVIFLTPLHSFTLIRLWRRGTAAKRAAKKAKADYYARLKVVQNHYTKEEGLSWLK